MGGDLRMFSQTNSRHLTTITDNTDLGNPRSD
jgi:hypothetical protein